MKKVIFEEDNEGLASLLGERVTLMCANYFYTGNLIGVSDECVKLENAAIVYETGAWSNENWADSQDLPGSIYVMKAAVEAFGVLK